MRVPTLVFLASLCALCAAQQFLSVQGGRLMLNGKPVFLSGVNQPWINYGSDFGNSDAAHGNGYGSTCALNSYLVNVSSAGGNSIRMWLFVEGASIPSFDQNGNVNGTDSTGSLIADLKRYLEAAEAQNMLVWFCLWNGAHLQNNNAKNLFADATKLQTFVDKVLTPMARALAPYRSLGGYEIINEPEGSVTIGSDSNPCFDTTSLSGSGAGWSGANIAMRDLQRFVNIQADAIHAADPKALVTVGSWSEHAVTDNFGFRNYWKDTCLQQAGGKQNGVLDLYQVHSYTYNNQYGPNAPFHHNASDFGLTKPIILGEFATYGSGSTSAQQYQYIHSHGYVGAWGWDAIGGTNVDNLPTLIGGMNAVRGQPDVPINIKGATPGPDCSCSDTAPAPAQYSCAQQASWGKCEETWMAGYCCRSCKGCQGCK